MLGNYYWTSTVILCHNVVFKFHHSTDDERNTNEVCYDSRTIFMRTVRAPKSGYDKNLHFVYWQNLCQSYRFRSEQQTFAIKQQLSRLETPQFRIFRSPCRRRIKLEHTFWLKLWLLPKRALNYLPRCLTTNWGNKQVLQINDDECITGTTCWNGSCRLYCWGRAAPFHIDSALVRHHPPE